jgi:hypothetical protein
MFVRWKKKYRKKKIFEEENKLTLCAVLVQNTRTGSKIDQKVIKYLSSVRVENLKHSHSRKIFWWKVNQKLDLLNPSEDDLASIKLSLQQVVPLPDKEDSTLKRAAEIRERIKEVASL